jgi:dolichyl-phosphate beta-glucosyltransferase
MHNLAYRLSIVIPAYNEEHRLPASLTTIRTFLRHMKWTTTTEIIIADDGSTDNTVSVLKGIASNWHAKKASSSPLLKILPLSHKGKGNAIKQGTLIAKGQYIFLCDADLSMPIDELPRLLDPLEKGYDFVISSREAKGSRRIDEPQYRHIMGRVFNMLVQLVVLSGFTDTQCGFKCARKEVAHTLAKAQRVTGFGFDIEWLLLAKLSEYSILEIPITWYHKENSRVNPIRDTLAMIREVFQIRRAAKMVTKDQLQGEVVPVEEIRN